MNWTKILKDAGIPDSPGYQETLKLIKDERFNCTRQGISQGLRLSRWENTSELTENID